MTGDKQLHPYFSNFIDLYGFGNDFHTLFDRGFAGKWTHYEQSLRVPLIIYDPRLAEASRGKVLSEMALNSDLASTMRQKMQEPLTQDKHH